MFDDDERPDNLIPISGSLVDEVADRIVARVEGELVSARAVRESAGQVVLVMLNKLVYAAANLAIEDAQDMQRTVSALNGLVKLVSAAELLELEDELPTDPVARRTMLEQFRAQARQKAKAE